MNIDLNTLPRIIMPFKCENYYGMQMSIENLVRSNMKDTIVYVGSNRTAEPMSIKAYAFKNNIHELVTDKAILFVQPSSSINVKAY